MKTLHFTHAGRNFACSLAPETFGHVTQYGEHSFRLPHEAWRIVGFSRHHWARHAAFPTAESIAKNPSQLVGSILWDKDHGTIRIWGGSYCGKLPRITSAYVS